VTATTTSYDGKAGRHAERSRRRWTTTLPRLVVAVAVAAFAFTTTGGSARHEHTGAEASTLSAGHMVAPLDRGSTSPTVSVDMLRVRERPVSRSSQRQAMADAARQRLRPATQEQGKETNAALAKLAASAEKQAGLLAKDAWQLPVTKGVYHLTARFGSCSGLWAHCHTGLDFAAPSGTPIHAVANGTITKTGWAGAYGNRTVETLPDGTEMWYAHQSAFGVKPRQKVVAGQQIGRVGATGNVTGPHVHLEVRPGGGDPVDPYQALLAHGLHP
jgi:murein DD-endopeptidase MepM/ murein hydrolase activator NlpD